jgi:hypothetical protein
MNSFYSIRQYSKANRSPFPSDPSLSLFFNSDIVSNIREKSNKEDKKRKGSKKGFIGSLPGDIKTGTNESIFDESDETEASTVLSEVRSIINTIIGSRRVC